MTAPPVIFDRPLHRRRLDRAASGFHRADFLKRRAADDLVMRIEAIHRRFAVAVDLGARTGVFARVLEASDAAAKIDHLIQTDLSGVMLERAAGPRLVADEERLPFAPESLDLVVSSLALHWVNDLVGTLIQIRRALKPDGLMMISLLGGATLTELRRGLLTAELEVRGGAGPRVSPFIDAADGADLLRRAGFALPVVDTDCVTVRYDHPLKLMADLRAMGETCALVGQTGGNMGRNVLERTCKGYDRGQDGVGGRIGATFEIITLTGWAPHPDQQKPLRRGSAKMRLADALGAVEHDAGEKAGG